MRLFGVTLVLGIFLGLSRPAAAASPVVDNVFMAQRTDGSGLVDVTYDLADADGDTCAVTLHLSDDGGFTWDFPVLSVDGDVGPGVAPGEARNIVWDGSAYDGGLLLENVSAKVVASDAGVEWFPHSPEHVAITDFTNIDWGDPAIIERFARADLCLVMGHHLWRGGDSADINALAALRELNPDVKILAYVSVKSAQLWGEFAPPGSFWRMWFDRTEPFFVTTTEGEIGMDWPTSRLINILEPGCRRAMIEIVMEMQSESLNVFDGVYWDYFNTVLWVAPDISNVGDPDMDGDGVGHWDDPDEMAAYRGAQVDLVTAARDSLGEDFIQFFNGQRAYADSNFASLGDGAYYELFPTLFFPDPDMQHALDPEWPFSLFNARPWFRTANGGPYLVLASTWYTSFKDDQGELIPIVTGDKFRAIALLGDFYASWNSATDQQGTLVYGWTSHDVSLGDPLGPPVFDGDFIRRDFRYGTVEIEMKTGAYPNPFDYRIWVLGELVSELAIPYHTP